MIFVTTKLDGKKLAIKIREDLKKRVENLKKNGIKPCLAVILVGEDPASKVYIRNKKKAAEKVGMETFDKLLPETTTEEELIKLIKKLNNDPKIHGILVQLPLPKTINEQHVMQAIDPAKDADGFHPMNIGKLFMNQAQLIPCTPHGIMKLISEYNIDLTGKNVVIVGRSQIVGMPLIALMMNANATVTVTHSYTQNLVNKTKNADVVITAIGKAEYFDESYFNENAIVVDVGTNRNSEGKLVGDVNYDSVNGKVAYLSPVPGGVGPMTITMLLEQTIQIAERSIK